MKKVLAGLLLALSTSGIHAAEVSSTVTFTNDYRFRGISQTTGDAAVQGSIDVGFENGAYIGIWGSNVDWGDDANIEVDYYGGYSGSITEALGYDVMLAYYSYPGYESADSDYVELITSLFYQDFTFSFAYSNDYANSDKDASYLSVDYSYGITEQVSLDLHAGHSFGDYWDNYGYEDYSIGVSGSVAGLDLSLAYLDNSLDVAETNNSDDSTVVFSVSRTF